MNYRQRATDCQRRHAVIYPEFVKARKRYERLDRCCTYWANRALEADREAKVEEGKVTHVPKDETKDSLERVKEKFRGVFERMSAEQQGKMIADIMNSYEQENLK